MRIQRAGWDIPQNLTWVPVDFTKDVLEEKLLACGFDQTVKTLLSWLGVTYYLTVEAIEKMLDGLSGICAEGSAVVLDYPDENFLTGYGKEGAKHDPDGDGRRGSDEVFHFLCRA